MTLDNLEIKTPPIFPIVFKLSTGAGSVTPYTFITNLTENSKIQDYLR